MSEASSLKRQIVRSTSIIGGATVGGLLISLVKMKLIALMIGPAGVGLLGALTAVMTMANSIAGMGIDTSAVRQLVAAQADSERLRIVRWALWTYVWPLAAIGSLACWLLREPLAIFALGSAAYAGEVGWVALGVGAGIVGAAQLAHVQAWRRMVDLARIRLWGALLAAIVSVAGIHALGNDGIVVAVVVTPVATCLGCWWFGRSVPAWRAGRFPGARALAPEWRAFAQLGSAVMLTTAVGSASQALVRGIITQQLGLDDAGLFQAAFSISSLNMGLVLGAMVPDYYPRVSAAAHDPGAVRELFNHQVHVGLLLAGPALVAISAAAPLVLQILYTPEFAGAATLLRLQVAADAIRVPGWALGFVLLAQKRSAAYVLLEVTLGALFVPLTWAAAQSFGVAAAGGAYLVGYATTFALALTIVARDRIGMDRPNSLLLAGLAAALLVVAAASVVNPVLATAAGAVAFIGTALYSLRELGRMGLSLSALAALVTGRAKGSGER